MSIYALVAGGRVVEIAAGTFEVHPDFVWVDVSSVTPRPETGWSATESGGNWSFAAPVTPTLTLAQQASALLAAGLTLTTAGTLALSGVTFATDALTQQQIQAELIALLASSNASFADGAATIAWPDTSGTLHTMTPVQFKELAVAIAAFVSACVVAIKGQATALPSASATITMG